MIREATIGDVPRLVEMGLRFRAATGYAGIIRENPEQLQRMAERLICEDDGTFLVLEDDTRVAIGMIGLVLFDHPLSGDRVAGEICWWVEPEHRGQGVRLLRAAEAWAARHGAMWSHMIAPNEAVGHFYTRLGYQFVEAAYQRRLP